MTNTIIKLLDAELPPQKLKLNLITLSILCIALKAFCKELQIESNATSHNLNDLLFFFLSKGYTTTLGVLSFFVVFILLAYICTLFSEVLTSKADTIEKEVNEHIEELEAIETDYRDSENPKYKLAESENFYESEHIPTQFEGIEQKDPYWKKANHNYEKKNKTLNHYKLALNITIYTKKISSIFTPIILACYALLLSIPYAISLIAKTWPY